MVIQSAETTVGPITRSLSAQLVVLIVEPSGQAAAKVERELERSGYNVTAERVSDAAALTAALDRTTWDIVISTADTADVGGLAVIQALRERQLETPVVLLTDHVDDVGSLESIAAGAEDVLKHEDLYRLPYVVGRILQHAQIRQDQSAMLRTGKLQLSRKRNKYTLRIALLAIFTTLLIIQFIPGAALLKGALIACLGIIAALIVLVPLERLRKQAAELSLGSLDREVPKGPGAFGDIATALDTLRKVDGVSLVVHVDPPADAKDYLHRAGRTARAGESGTVVTVATHEERRTVFRLTEQAGVTAAHTRVRPGHADLVRITGARPPAGEPVAEREVARPPKTRRPAPTRVRQRPTRVRERQTRVRARAR